MSENKTGLSQKIKWAVTHYYDLGKSRPEAVTGLMEQFGCKHGYARTIVYNHLCHLDWKRAPYPKNRKSRNSEQKEKVKKDELTKKFKVDEVEIAENDEIPTNFDF